MKRRIQVWGTLVLLASTSLASTGCEDPSTPVPKRLDECATRPEFAKQLDKYKNALEYILTQTDKDGLASEVARKNIHDAWWVLLPRTTYAVASEDFATDVHNYLCSNQAYSIKECARSYLGKAHPSSGDKIVSFEEKFSSEVLEYAEHEIGRVRDQLIVNHPGCESGPTVKNGRIVGEACTLQPYTEKLPGYDSAEEIAHGLELLARLNPENRSQVKDALKAIDHIKGSDLDFLLSLKCSTSKAFTWLEPGTGDSRPSDQDGHLGPPPPPVGLDDLGPSADVAI
ncbi:MAG TPA: hypothetical protein VL588_11685 [Bdellovibrionota bacterium]|jgi:hypothetical protein|nr:hypothetical protein [Bdellovibrionota bacterium]